MNNPRHHAIVDERESAGAAAEYEAKHAEAEGTADPDENVDHRVHVDPSFSSHLLSVTSTLGTDGKNHHTYPRTGKVTVLRPSTGRAALPSPHRTELACSNVAIRLS